MEVRFCTTSDGVRIAFATYGSGYPLVWVPGWVSHIELDWPIFGQRIEAWADEYMVVRYDKRGTGLSDRNQQDLSVEARVRDIEAVVDALKLKRFALLGISEGGPIALFYAAEHPRRVSHLIVQGSYANGRFGRQEVREALRSLVRAEWGLATSSFTSMLLPDASAEQIKAFAKLQLAGASVDDALALLEEIERIDVRPVLPKITAPTLVLHGKQDRAIPFDTGRELAGAIPNARLVSYDGGHLPMYESDVGKWIHETTRDFLAETTRGRTKKAPTRKRREPAESGVRTVLFTDLVGHTEMMSRLGDARGRDVLREHERVTREVLQRHGGYEVKTMGDGFMASFGSVSKAMECAVALQRAIAEWNASERGQTAPLHVRVGLNAGEPIAEEGDLFGSAVILAARVAAQAGEGEILIPEPVRHLLSGKEFLFADRGDFLPKGFEDRVRLYEVRWRE